MIFWSSLQRLKKKKNTPSISEYRYIYIRRPIKKNLQYYADQGFTKRKVIKDCCFQRKKITTCWWLWKRCLWYSTCFPRILLRTNHEQKTVFYIVISIIPLQFCTKHRSDYQQYAASVLLFSSRLLIIPSSSSRHSWNPAWKMIYISYSVIWGCMNKNSG